MDGLERELGHGLDRLLYQMSLALELVCFFGGLGAVVFGSWEMYRPAGFIIGGLLLVIIGMLINRDRDKNRRR